MPLTVSALNRPPPEVIVAADDELVNVTTPTSLNAPALDQLPPTVIACAPVSPAAAAMVRLPATERVSLSVYVPPLPLMVSAPKVPPPEVSVPAAEVPVSVTAPVSVNVPALNQLPPTANELPPVTVPARRLKLPVQAKASLKVWVPAMAEGDEPLPRMAASAVLSARL